MPSSKPRSAEIPVWHFWTALGFVAVALVLVPWLATKYPRELSSVLPREGKFSAFTTLAFSSREKLESTPGKPLNVRVTLDIPESGKVRKASVRLPPSMHFTSESFAKSIDGNFPLEASVGAPAIAFSIVTTGFGNQTFEIQLLSDGDLPLAKREVEIAIK